MQIYCYSSQGDLLHITECNNINVYANQKLYINSNKYFYNEFHRMDNLKEINHLYNQESEDEVIIVHLN